MFRGENATCNRQKWAGNHRETIQELWQSYHVESCQRVKFCSAGNVHTWNTCIYTGSVPVSSLYLWSSVLPTLAPTISPIVCGNFFESNGSIFQAPSARSLVAGWVLVHGPAIGVVATVDRPLIVSWIQARKIFACKIPLVNIYIYIYIFVFVFVCIYISYLYLIVYACKCFYPLKTYRVLLELLLVGGWGWWRSLHVCTCLMLRNCCVALAHMWDATELLRCSCTNVGCYATDGMGSLACARGLGWWRSCICTHVRCYATDWGDLGGWDDDVRCMWTYVRCYAIDGVGWGDDDVPCHFASYGKHSLNIDVTCSARTCWNLWTKELCG